jgi:ribosomal protein L24
MAAKLRFQENQEVSTNMALVVDSYAAADIEQYLLGKDIDIAGSVFKNGYAGVVRNAVMYVSENLAGEYTQVVDVATADETITVEGVTFTAKATPSAAGEFDVAGTVDAQGAIMANMINGASTGQDSATGYFEVSDADRATLENAQISASYDDATDTLTITGAGRIAVSTTMSGDTNDWLNCYFGKKGSIDLVVQDMSPVDMRPTDDRRGTNVFSSYLAGIKTFTDGSKKFLQVKVAI